MTPLGIGAETYWQGLLAGRSGVGPVEDFDCSAIATRIAAQVKDFKPEDYLDRKETKRMDRFAQFAAAASLMAVADAKLAHHRRDPRPCRRLYRQRHRRHRDI